MLDLVAPPEPPWIKQNLRVPRQDDTLFARPELAVAAARADDNRAALEVCPIDLARRSLAHLRRWSREQVLAAARDYTAGLIGQPIAAEPVELLFAGGHQPALFHPGVWVKNFAIGALARQNGAASLNLIVDNDTLASTAIGVPVGDRLHPRLEAVAFDDPRPTQPWEEAHIVNRDLFDSFAQRVGRRMSAWGVEPLVGAIWTDAMEVTRQTGSLRDALTAARHCQERRWGTANLELPLSRLCELDPFLWFASHLLVELPRFREIHNEVLGEFRQVNRIRSHTHPVPELTAEADGWLEAPFWIWRAGEHRRHKVFARQDGKEILLSDGKETFARLPLAPGGEACCAVEALRELPRQGIRLRTRALTTTLFARLCLADLFVHGIGGSKYDEMTDRIIHRFYRLKAPSFLTLSATLHLPVAEPFDVKPADVARLKQRQRDLQFNSDRHLASGAGPKVGALIAEKQTLIDQQRQYASQRRPAHERRGLARANHDRFRRLRDVDRQLAQFTLDQQRQIESEIAATEEQLAANAILQSRELSFCLFPADKLRSFMTNLPVR